MRNTIFAVLMIVLTSCGSTKITEREMIVSIPSNYTLHDIEFVLRDNNYTLEMSSSNKIITAWRKTKVELTTFRVEVIQRVDGWEMKGRVRYEAYRDREMDESVFTEEYVYPNSDVFVIQYGWNMLTKIGNELVDDFQDQ